jgi:hypothetical protein
MRCALHTFGNGRNWAFSARDGLLLNANRDPWFY